MARILVSGVANVEVSLPIYDFPIQYEPVRYPESPIRSSVAGVGYNMAKALSVLGSEVTFVSLVGPDLAGRMIGGTLQDAGISHEFVVPEAAETPQSVILFDRDGRRQINTYLKGVRESQYPPELFLQALEGCALAAMTNIQFSRPLLALARQAGVRIATDVHVISNLDDEYNAEFMRYADILFMSGEALPEAPESWARKVLDRYGPEIVVIGLGEEGALLATRSDRLLERLPAVSTRPIVSTVGAGDALFSCFLHSIAAGQLPVQALQRALIFASYKMGAAGGAQGFLTQEELDALVGERRS